MHGWRELPTAADQLGYCWASYSSVSAWHTDTVVANTLATALHRKQSFQKRTRTQSEIIFSFHKSTSDCLTSHQSLSCGDDICDDLRIGSYRLNSRSNQRIDNTTGAITCESTVMNITSGITCELTVMSITGGITCESTVMDITSGITCEYRHN